MSVATIPSPFIHGRPPTWASGYGQDQYGYFAEFSIVTGPHYWQFITQRMRWIPAGCFTMGSPETVRLVTAKHLSDFDLRQAVFVDQCIDDPRFFQLVGLGGNQIEIEDSRLGGLLVNF